MNLLFQMLGLSLSDDEPFCGSGRMKYESMFREIGLDDSMDAEQGMIMYMDGFRFSLAGGAPCLNLYFPSWTLDTREKFWIAMMGVVLLSIATEGASKIRSKLSKRLKGGVKRWIITLLHGIQALMGYILMLATMTFSVELLFCVIIGLGIGFALFYDEDDLHVTTNPCCNFIQDEFNERASTLRRQNLEEEEDQANEDRTEAAAPIAENQKQDSQVMPHLQNV